MNQLPKKTIYLIGVFLVIIGLTVFVIWKGFFVGPSGSATADPEVEKLKVKLDFSLLQSESIEELKKYEKISLPDKEMGREDPLKFYEVEEETEEE